MDGRRVEALNTEAKAGYPQVEHAPIRVLMPDLREDMKRLQRKLTGQEKVLGMSHLKYMQGL